MFIEIAFSGLKNKLIIKKIKPNLKYQGQNYKHSHRGSIY